VKVGNEERTPIIVKNRRTFIIEDACLVAALITFDQNTVCSPVVSCSGRVAFEVRGDIANNLERLNAGEPAPLDLFIGNLKQLQASVSDLRNRGERG
jgi:hypothetical protein